jgi:hypothetical protein
VTEFWRARDKDQDCGEVARVDLVDLVVVRDSKSPDGPVLTFTRAEWKELLDGVKSGRFDLDFGSD